MHSSCSTAAVVDPHAPACRPAAGLRQLATRVCNKAGKTAQGSSTAGYSSMPPGPPPAGTHAAGACCQRLASPDAACYPEPIHPQQAVSWQPSNTRTASRQQLVLPLQVVQHCAGHADRMPYLCTTQGRHQRHNYGMGACRVGTSVSTAHSARSWLPLWPEQLLHQQQPRAVCRLRLP